MANIYSHLFTIQVGMGVFRGGGAAPPIAQEIFALFKYQ